MVQKFGGTFFPLDEETFDSALATVCNEVKVQILTNGLVWVIASAFTGVTRRLDEICTICKFSRGDSQIAIAKMKELFKKHAPLCFPPDLLHVDLAAIETEVDKMLEEACDVIDRLCSASYQDRERLEATVLSYGERLATMVLRHRMRQIGLRVRYVPAYSIMWASAPGPSTFRNANVDVDPTVASIQGVLNDDHSQLLVDSSLVVSHGINMTIPNVFLTEGFIGRTVLGNRVTFGYDASDLSAIAIAYALDVDAVLCKCIDGELEAKSIDELLQQMRAIEGDKGRIVGVKALEFAQKYGVTIVLRDPRTGYEHRLEPRASQAKVIKMT